MPDLIERFVNGVHFPELSTFLLETDSPLNNPNEVVGLIKKYRTNKDFEKIGELLAVIMDAPASADSYGEKLENLIFNDPIIIRHFASNSPELLIRFTDYYPPAAISRGGHLIHILTGLFAEEGNPIYAEIQQYQELEGRVVFLDEYWLFDQSSFQFGDNNNKTSLTLIAWLAAILGTFPSSIKEDIRNYLNQYHQKDPTLYNSRIFSDGEAQFFLRTDPVFQSIRLFRILLVEVTFINQRSTVLVSRILLMFYSAWDFVASRISLKSEVVMLDNDAFTANEYLLKYLFHGYLSLIILQEHAAIFRKATQEENRSGRGILQQLFHKTDHLIASEKISADSSQYYISHLIAFYFKLPGYFGETNKTAIDEMGGAVLWQLRKSMSNSPFGEPAIFTTAFRKVCEGYDFYRDNDERNIERAREFYNFLRPYTEELEWRICDI